jgi:hypothetical protein
LLIKFNSPGEEQEPVSYLRGCITGLTGYLLDELPDRDLVGLNIRNLENALDKPVGISFTASGPVETCRGLGCAREDYSE